MIVPVEAGGDIAGKNDTEYALHSVAFFPFLHYVDYWHPLQRDCAGWKQKAAHRCILLPSATNSDFLWLRITGN